jgi:hypothetical protein
VSEPPPIDDELELYRRVTVPDWLVPDENRDCTRLSSAAFSADPMSVVIDDTLRASGREPVDILDRYPSDYLVALTVGLVREHEQQVIRSPIPDEPAHADVVGKKTKGRRRAFATAATWIVGPDNPC